LPNGVHGPSTRRIACHSSPSLPTTRACCSPATIADAVSTGVTTAPVAASTSPKPVHWPSRSRIVWTRPPVLVDVSSWVPRHWFTVSPLSTLRRATLLS